MRNPHQFPAPEVRTPTTTEADPASADLDKALLRLVLDTTRDAHVAIDGEGRITDWNPAAEVLFGWSRAEALGRTLADTIVPARLREDHRGGVRRYIAGGAARHTGRRVELPAVGRDGVEFPVEMHVAPLRVGAEWRFSAFIRHARERDDRRMRFARTERVSGVGSWDWDVVAGTIEWSEEVCRIYGVDPAMAPRSVEDLLPYLHPEDRETVGAAIRRVAAVGGSYSVEYRITRPDGELRTIHSRGTALFDEHGVVERVLGTAQDVSERARREAEIRRLAALVDATRDAVVTVGRDGRITSWNSGAERLFGLTAAEAVGRDEATLVPAGRRGEEQAIRTRVLAGDRVDGFETQRVTPVGSVRDVLLTVAPVRDAAGRVVELSSIITDITAGKRAERKLERYVDDLEALALRDPLTGLLTRRELHGVLEAELARADRDGKPCSVVLLDVDGLREVNEREGRQAGDQVLRELAALAASVSTTGHHVCRAGDDEVAIVVPGAATGPATALARRVQACWRERGAAARVSAGVATFPADAPDKDGLLEQACARVAGDKPARPAAGAPEDGDGRAKAADTVERILGLLRGHLGLEVAYLTEFAGDEQVVRLTDAGPEGPPIRAGMTAPLQDTSCVRVVRGELPHVIADTALEPVTAALPAVRAAGVGAYVGVPVRFSDGRLYGTVCAVSREPRRDLDASATQFARVCARLIADLLEHQHLERDNRRMQAELTGVRALMAALDARDHYTGAHSEAVVSLAVAVARRLGLDAETVAAVEQVAMLHDIGKIGIPDGVLQKPGPLDEGEWETMRRHPVIGAQIVASITSLSHLAPAIRGEHERWDGGGYPDGLAREAIPVASRIVLACDALHAMTSDRPYRRAMPMAAAEAELRKHAGTQFDPAVVDALLAEIATAAPATAEDEGAGELRVLVVDDNAALRLALEHGLASEGFRVRVACTAAEAYAAAGEEPFDLVVLDWVLPGGDGGATACRRLRALQPAADVVVHTGLSDVRDQRAAFDAGAVAFLQKGIPLEALAERLRSVAQAP